MSKDKYSIDIPDAVFDANGLAKNDGWVVLYHSDTRTREYTGVNRDFVPAGFGLAAGAYLDAPELTKDKTKAICRNEDGSAWELVDDLRGKQAYHMQTRKPHLIDEIGPLPEGWTLLKPQDEYSVWDGDKWVDDTEARRRDEVKAADTERESRIQEADQIIAMMERAIKTGMATDEEIDRHEAWMNYSVVVYRIDPEDTPDISWPARPQ